MKKTFSLPYRQIHLDFHTGPWIGDVGRDFDAKAFASTMKKASVNSVTVFAKCHHGHLYYATKRPERHPGLRRNLDLTRSQVDALHAEGIRAPIYISVQCDEYAANTHPEWIALRADSAKVKWGGVFGAGWQIMDMSSPYQEFLADQTKEILARFRPVDGIFFDMCWDQPSTSPWAIAGMVAEGLNPEVETDRGIYARRVALRYMKRFHAMVKRSSPNATVFFNCRPFFNLAEDIEFQEQIEIEALPTGGWGYVYFPKNVRYARTFDKPSMGMTARFHKSWADFGGLKPYPALEYETSQMVSLGARCSIGDQLHPRGTLDAGAYELIGKVYGRIAAREPWLEGATPVSQIGVFQVPSGNLGTTQSTSGTDEGVTRMLTQLKCQFDVVSAVTRNLESYDVLILPDVIALDEALVGRLRAYVKKGGALLASGTSGLTADGTRLLLPELGVVPSGMSPYSATYIRFKRAIAQDVPPSDHIMYEKGVRVRPGRGTQVLAGVVEPYFERAWNHFCSHQQTPGDTLSRFAAATVHGRTGYISYPIFSAFAKHGNYPYRLLVRNILNQLLPDPVVRVVAPTTTEVTVTVQKAGAGHGRRWIVHLLHYHPERRTKDLDLIEDIIPLNDVKVSLKIPRAPAMVYLAPERTAIPFKYADGRVDLTVPQVSGHAMVVFEERS